MRIIAGSARGTPLAVPADVTRPTADRTREALFSILGDSVPGARVLDLFAGSGALGLEALSRGAAGALFVDQSRAASETIVKNASKARLSDRATVRRRDVAAFLHAPPDVAPFDLIFADPPYKKSPDAPDLAFQFLSSPTLPKWLAPEGMLIVEDASTRAGHPGEKSQKFPWELIDTRTYGAARIRLFRSRHPA